VIRVNGEPSAVAPGETVAGLVASLGVEPQAPGVAVAVDGEVVPRGAWEQRTVQDGAAVEVLTAMQGG